MNHIKNFWDWFVQNENVFFNLEKNNPEQIFPQLMIALKNLDPNLTFEFSQPQNPREFIISAGGITNTFPLVTELIKQAPTLANWKFIGFKQPKQLTTDSAIGMNGKNVPLSDFYFILSDAGDHANLDLFIKNYSEGDDALMNTGFIFLDSLIGEYVVGTKLGAINFNPFSELPNLQPLIDLPKAMGKYL